jgi:hypothetical protein
LRELTASQLVALATRSDTGSHNILDLIQSLVPPHYVCDGYVLAYYHNLHNVWNICLVFSIFCKGKTPFGKKFNTEKRMSWSKSVPITNNVIRSNPAHDETSWIQHYVIKFVSDMQQFRGFLRILRFSSANKTGSHDITEILLKVALSTFP